ncbi:tetratricopeptide repeat protein [Rubrivirga sp. IMCC45206]|uniref:tetratricopeptide repeat protein n=1 Tax=Rubrivirga sp. IMCC45206 TaxID=3391614 RepID=UPI00398FE941
MPSRFLTLALTLVVALLVGGADGCSSDPNVEGAKLDLRNGDYEQALQNLDTALETNPDNTEALLLRVEVLRQQYENTPGTQPKAAFLAANYDAMVESLMRAERLAPDDPAVDQAKLALWALAVNAGNDVIRNPDADVADAINYFEQSTTLMPDSTQGYLGLGLAYLREGESTQALAPFQRGTEINDADPVLAYYYGRTLVLADRATDAVAYLEDAQTRFPADEDIQTMLLNAYTLSGQNDRAIERYEDAIQRQPDNPAFRYNYGALLLQSERYDDAIVQLQRATELDPTNSDAFYNLGAAYQNLAAALNERANATEDVDEANDLIDQRNVNLETSLGPLMQAKTLSTGTADEAGVYTQLGRVDDAEGVAECAGISMD